MISVNPFSVIYLFSVTQSICNLTFWEMYAGPSEINYIHNLASKRPKYRGNSNLDVYTKIALLNVSPSVVGLVSYSGNKLNISC